MSRSKCNAIVLFCSFLAGLELNLHLSDICFHAKNLSTMLSLTILKFIKKWAIIWNNYNKLSENVWFVGVYMKNKSARAICARTVLKGGWYLKNSSAPMTHHNQSDLGSLILIWVTPKVRDLTVRNDSKQVSINSWVLMTYKANKQTKQTKKSTFK